MSSDRHAFRACGQKVSIILLDPDYVLFTEPVCEKRYISQSKETVSGWLGPQNSRLLPDHYPSTSQDDLNQSMF